MRTEDILQGLGLSSANPGACWGQSAWSSSRGAGVIESINPSDGSVIAKVYGCSEMDYAHVVSNSVTAQKSWQQVPAPVRGNVVRRIGEALREKKDLLGSLIALEMGKVKQEAEGEVQEMIDMAEFAVGQSRMLYGVSMHSERPKHRMYEQWHPIGVVGVITAFNFPVAVWAWNAFIAVIAGNSVIWKPSSKTPLCAIAVQHICNQVMHDMGYQGLFSLYISNQQELAERLVHDERVKLVSFTGSSRVGHRVASVVSQRLGRYLLECSGNNALIVDETADLDLAIPAIVFGAVGTAGQRCTSTRRLLVHERVYTEVIQRLVVAYKQVHIGNPLHDGVLMGPLIDNDAVMNYTRAVNSAVDAGARLLVGGNALVDEGFFVEPTLLEVAMQYEVVRQETFAPILYVMRFKDIDEAIAMQNDVPQGLSSALFTLNMRNAELFLSAQGSDCGIANINIGTSGAEIGGAFGGEKETGGGREAGSDAWKAYMRRQTNTINWGKDLPLAQGIKFELGEM